MMIKSGCQSHLQLFILPLIVGMFWEDTALGPLLKVLMGSPAALSCVLTVAVVKAFFWYPDRDQKRDPNKAVELSSGEEAQESGMNLQADMEISERYIRVCKGNMVKAQQMWQKSLAWRKKNSVATILEEPQPHFHTIKRCYPHVLHGRTRKGELVCYENPGRMEVKGMIEGSVGPPEMGRHYTFMNELVFTHLLPKDEDQIMTVMNVGEISMSLMNSTVIGYLKATARIMQDHYPERVARICVVNCPFWLPAAWARVSRLMPRTISEKFSFASSSNAMKALSKFLESDQVPSSYGGTGGCLGEAEEEQFVVDFVAKLNGKKSGNLLAGNTEDLFGGSPEENSKRSHRRSSSAPLPYRKMNSASIKRSASRELPAEVSARTLEKKKKKKGLKHKVKKVILRKKKKKNTVAGSEIMTEDDLKGQAEFEQLVQEHPQLVEKWQQWKEKKMELAPHSTPTRVVSETEFTVKNEAPAESTLDKLLDLKVGPLLIAVVFHQGCNRLHWPWPLVQQIGGFFGEALLQSLINVCTVGAVWRLGFAGIQHWTTRRLGTLSSLSEYTNQIVCRCSLVACAGLVVLALISGIFHWLVAKIRGVSIIEVDGQWSCFVIASKTFESWSFIIVMLFVAIMCTFQLLVKI